MSDRIIRGTEGYRLPIEKGSDNCPGCGNNTDNQTACCVDRFFLQSKLSQAKAELEVEREKRKEVMQECFRLVNDRDLWKSKYEQEKERADHQAKIGMTLENKSKTERLAEALKENEVGDNHYSEFCSDTHCATACKKAKEALAAYEEGKKK